MHALPRLLALAVPALAAPALLAGCAAAWGGPSHVTAADQGGITIEYDPLFYDAAKADSQARDHCGGFGMTAVATDSHSAGALGGIVEARFRCVPPGGR